MNFKSSSWIVTSDDRSIIHWYCGHRSIIHWCQKDVAILSILKLHVYLWTMASHRVPYFPLSWECHWGRWQWEVYFWIVWRVWKVPTIYPSVSNLAGSALNNYEKKISGLLRISRVYVTSKNCTLIISLMVMPES